MGWGGPTSPPDVFPGGRLRRRSSSKAGSRSTQRPSKVAEALPMRLPRLSWHCSPDLDERFSGIPSHQPPSASSSSSSSVHRSWAEPWLWWHFAGSIQGVFGGGSGHPGTAGQWGWHRWAMGLAAPGSGAGTSLGCKRCQGSPARPCLPVWQQPWCDVPSPAGVCPSPRPAAAALRSF